jgi:hypothetical protein
VLIFLLTSAVAVLYAFENWRGNRAWNKYRQAAEARGEPMDIGALVTKSGPGDQGSEPPFAKELADFGRSPEQTGRLSNPDSSKSPDR